MANVKKSVRQRSKQHVLNAAARSFLQNGFTNTTLKDICSTAGISSGSFNSYFRTKEDVLYDLVGLVLGQQFSVSQKLLEGKTEDKLLFYAVETVLQLHIMEMSEALRDVYSAAYSLPKTSDLIQQSVTSKWEYIFKEHLPNLETKDFYMLEIATGGIMRGFMTVPCNMWFTMDRKVESFLECSFRMYQVPDEKINEAKAYVKQFDFKAIARQTIENLFRYLEENPYSVTSDTEKEANEYEKDK